MEKEEVKLIVRQTLAELSESDNPLSAKCERALETVPKCWDFRGIRRYVMCDAWRRMEQQRIPFAQAIRESWGNAKGVCTWE